jgi:multidrug efflux pump subunit AcrB
MVLALQMLQNRVAEARGELPADTELTVERLTPAVFPVFILSLTGSLPTADLNDYASFVMRPALARVPGTGQIEVLASDTREIEVVLDPLKLNAAQLTVTEVSEKLKAQNQLLPVGRFAESGQQHLALASGLWTSVDQIASAPIIVKDGATIRVADLGKVVQGAPDRTLLVTGNGRDAVSVSISQQIGANILDLKAGIEQTLRDLAHSLPAGLKITKVYDLAEFVATAIANVRDAILIGGFLAVVVLVAFLTGSAAHADRRHHAAARGHPDAVFLHVFGGSSTSCRWAARRRHRPRHRRCGGGGGEHPSSRVGRRGQRGGLGVSVDGAARPAPR